MRDKTTAGVGRWLRAMATGTILLAGPALLASCASSGSGLSGFLSGGQQDKPDDISSDYFTRPEYCPRIEIRAGTESFTLYERGQEGETSAVRYQASISRTARECRKTQDGLAIKVGVGGRVVAGPKGGAGSVTLPLRIVVTQRSTGVIYSELFNLPVSISPPALSADFSHVVPQIPITATSQQKDFIIYVGFDDGKAG